MFHRTEITTLWNTLSRELFHRTENEALWNTLSRELFHRTKNEALWNTLSRELFHRTKNEELWNTLLYLLFFRIVYFRPTAHQIKSAPHKLDQNPTHREHFILSITRTSQTHDYRWPTSTLSPTCHLPSGSNSLSSPYFVSTFNSY